jgi:hypothetical protein
MSRKTIAVFQNQSILINNKQILINILHYSFFKVHLRLRVYNLLIIKKTNKLLEVIIMKRLVTILKEKILKVSLCGLLATSLLTSSSIAMADISSDNIRLIKFESGVKTYSSDGTSWSSEKIKSPDPILIKEENGTKLYSIDGGETFTDEIPQGFEDIVEKMSSKRMHLRPSPNSESSSDASDTSLQDISDLKFDFSDSETPANFDSLKELFPDEHPKILIKEENGTKLYSIDGGETFTDEIPQGFEDIVEKMSLKKLSVVSDQDIFDKLDELNIEILIIKEQEGMITYSIDGGLSFSDSVPEGLQILEDTHLFRPDNELMLPFKNISAEDLKTDSTTI